MKYGCMFNICSSLIALVSDLKSIIWPAFGFEWIESAASQSMWSINCGRRKPKTRMILKNRRYTILQTHSLTCMKTFNIFTCTSKKSGLVMSNILTSARLILFIVPAAYLMHLLLPKHISKNKSRTRGFDANNINVYNTGNQVRFIVTRTI